MSDIFDESEDLKDAKSFAAFLRDEYQRVLHDGVSSPTNVDELRLRTHLANNWPGDEIITQIVRDVARIMRANRIKPEDIK